MFGLGLDRKRQKKTEAKMAYFGRRMYSVVSQRANTKLKICFLNCESCKAGLMESWKYRAGNDHVIGHFKLIDHASTNILLI